MIAEKFFWSQVNPLIELHVSADLFCFVFSSRPNHAEFRTWKMKPPLSQVKLFKPPVHVVRETISIIQKTLLPTGVFFFSPLNQVKISLHLGIYFTNSTHIWLRQQLRPAETRVFPKLNELTNHSRLVLDMQIVMPCVNNLRTASTFCPMQSRVNCQERNHFTLK